MTVCTLTYVMDIHLGHVMGHISGVCDRHTFRTRDGHTSRVGNGHISKST
jgi:hypothetical protein